DGVGAAPMACNLPTEEVPAGTDWDRWLGPAPQRGYNAILCPKGIHSGFPRWRAYREYAGGYLADMGAHHFDIAQWAMDMDGSGPVKIEPPRDKKENRGLRFVYASGVEVVHAASGAPDCRFIGADGTIDATRGRISSHPESI